MGPSCGPKTEQSEWGSLFHPLNFPLVGFVKDRPQEVWPCVCGSMQHKCSSEQDTELHSLLLL